MLDIRKAIRTLQVYFPFLQDYRFRMQRTMRAAFRIVHEEDFHILDYLPLRDGDLLIDAGANRGDAIQSMLMKRPKCRVAAFEPNPVLVEKLRRLYHGNPRVAIYEAGLGSSHSVVTLHVPFYREYMFDGLASFHEQNAKEWLTTRVYGFRHDWLSIRRVHCAIKPLDSFELNPAFIKIDVQGFEGEVLRGCRETLRRCRPVLLIETPGKNECAMLRTMDYEPFVMENGVLYPGTGKFNVLFIPCESGGALMERVGSKKVFGQV